MIPQVVPRLGLGCAALGNLFVARSEEQATAILEAAWEAGIRQFDTAPHYGLGLSEERLGRFLRTKPRAEFSVSTKVGRLIRNNPTWDGQALDDEGFVVPAAKRRVLDYSAAGVKESLDDSLTRLGLDRVDILYVHDPERSGVDDALRQGLAALADLRNQGMVGAIGAGSMSPETLVDSARSGLADVLMVAGRYTLLDQRVAPDTLTACTANGVAIVAAAVFNSGLLAAAPHAGASYDYQAVPPEVLARAEAIAQVCADHAVDLPTAALHYPLLDQRVSCVMVGADAPEQVRQNVERYRKQVPASLWDELAERELVPRCG